MHCITSGVITWDELRNYFSGSGWARTDVQEDRISGGSGKISFNIEPEKVMYSYNVFSLDDRSDSEDGVSDEPLKEIAKFLSKDLPGGEFFTKRSNRSGEPEITSNFLKYIAAATIKNKSNLSKMLRRVACNINISNVQTRISGLVCTYRFALSVGNAFKELYWKIKGKGWDVHISDDEQTLKITLGDEFEADIEVHGIQYHYIFQVSDHTELTESGVTYDPIASFRNYYKDEKISDAINEVRRNVTYEHKDDDGGTTVNLDKIPGPPNLPHIDPPLKSEDFITVDPFGKTIKPT
ncbi:MAG TPA: hypothetical protein ENI61_06435 [Ignavibacteria bacterium]|nr:hypothetical protein [Ignavibacteria bacterium]